MQRYINVLKVEPYKLPVEIRVQNNLKAKQDIVGGDIEYLYLEDDNSVAIICNECGKLEGLPLNRDIGYDIIAGTFLIVRDEDTGEDRSLFDEQIEKYKKKFNEKSIADTETKVAQIMLSKNKIYEI